jgi:putative FmdB family regulatory protein
MPTYEFKCISCGHLFERFLSISDNSKQKCPVCGNNTKRLISSGAGLIFKGSGFYVNDYRKTRKTEKTVDEKSK